MAIKDQAYFQRYNQARKIAPDINTILESEDPVIRSAIEQKAKDLLKRYDQRRINLDILFGTLSGLGTLAGLIAIYYESGGFTHNLSSHDLLLGVGFLGIASLLPISITSIQESKRLYRAFAYLERQEQNKNEPISDVRYPKKNLEHLIP